jgi:hypothetical protein
MDGHCLGSSTGREMLPVADGVAQLPEPFEGDVFDDGFVEDHGLVELWTLHERENTGNKPGDLNGIDDFCFPSGVRVVMEPIRILHDVPQLLDILRVEDLMCCVYSLIAKSTKWSQQCPRRKVLGACDAEKRFDVRAQRTGNFTLIAYAVRQVVTKIRVSAIMLGD